MEYRDIPWLALIEWDRTDATTVSMGNDAVPIDSTYWTFSDNGTNRALRRRLDASVTGNTIQTAYTRYLRVCKGNPTMNVVRESVLEYVDYGSAGNDFVQSDGEDE